MLNFEGKVREHWPISLLSAPKKSGIPLKTAVKPSDIILYSLSDGF